MLLDVVVGVDVGVERVGRAGPLTTVVESVAI